MVRITSPDINLTEAIKLIADNNPGALEALVQSTEIAEKVDPDDWAGPFAAIIQCDSLEIYGSKIYIIWNDICSRDTVKFLAVLRAAQLGILRRKELYQAIKDEHDHKLDHDTIMAQVQERLPNFNKEV